MNAIDQFIAKQEREKREIIEALRSLILEAGPNIEERLAHGIPFFYYYGRFCYINPVKVGVDLGFCHGVELGNEQGILQAKDRVEVRTVCIRSLNHFPLNEIRDMIQEAMLVNEWHAKKR